MQWFTEVMELFFISMELIKTSNLYFVWIFGHNKGWPAGPPCLSVTLSGLEYAKRSHVYTTAVLCTLLTPLCWSFCERTLEARDISILHGHLDHRMFPRSPGSPRSCSEIAFKGSC